MRFIGGAYCREIRIIFGIYSLGFLAGTHTHLSGLLQNGFLAQNASVWFNIYWDSLTLLDPLAVLLLWTKPKTGVKLAAAIMLTDIIINAYSYSAGSFGTPVAGMIPVWLLLQSLFATFIFVTATMVVGKLEQEGKTKL